MQPPFEQQYPRSLPQSVIPHQVPMPANTYSVHANDPVRANYVNQPVQVFQPPRNQPVMKMSVPQQPVQSNYEMVHQMNHPGIQTYPTNPQIQRYQPMQIQTHPRQTNDENQGYEYPQQQYEYEEGEPNEEEQQEDDVHNQQIILFWEHKFYTIYERFQWVHDKVEWMRTEFYNLNNELKAVDSQSEWNDAKEHHEDYIQQLEEFSQELTGVLNENQNLLEQRQIEGEENGVWKQRYYQLFQSFKLMEQELLQSKENKNQTQNQEEDERYQEFVENYRQLERQYTNVINELEEYKRKEPQSDEVKEYRGKLDYALKQAEKYKDILDRLHEENQEMNGVIEELREKNSSLEQNMNGNNPQLQYQLNNYAQALQERQGEMEKMQNQMEQMHISYQNIVQRAQLSEQMEMELETRQKQIESLKSNVIELKADHKSVSTVTEEYQRLLKNKYNQIEDKNNEIHRLRKQLTQSSSSFKNEPVREVVKKDYEQRIQKIENQYEKRISQLKKKLKQKEEQAEMSGLTALKLQSCEKKIKLLNQEIMSMTETLEQKDKENLQLKRFSYEAEKLRGIETQYNLLLEERDSLNGALLQKNYDIDNLQTQLNEFEIRIRQINEKNVNNQSKVLISEIEELNEIIRSKDGEITKVRSSLALKETYVEELELQVSKANNSNTSLEKYYENEKEIWMEKITSLERKNQEVEKKMRELQHEFGATMIRNLQDQIKSLRAQNQSKQESIIRMEGQELELRSRISHYERIRNSHTTDVDELSARIRQLQNSKAELLRKMEIMFKEVKTKEREIKDYIDNEINLKHSYKNVQNKYEEAEILVKEKEKIIKQLEEQLSTTTTKLQYITDQHDSLRMRRRDETDIFIKESDDLRRKLLEYEQSADYQKELQTKHGESLTRIQSKLLKQLQEENQLLKIQLANAVENLNQVNEAPTFKNIPKKKSSNYIQQRLFDFNSKLDNMIIENKEISENSNFQNNPSHKKTSSLRGGENWSGTFKFGGETQNDYEDVKSLKKQLNDLRRYCARLEVQIGGEEKQPMVILQQEKMYTDQCEYYKQTVVELESRIKNLIEVNTSLKNRLTGLLKGGEQESSTITYYREQFANAQETIDNLNKKLRKALEENRGLRLNSNETTTKLCRNYEDKIFECENKIFTLQRKLTNLEVEKIKGENEKANLARNLKVSQSEVETMKTTLEKKLKKTLASNDQLSEEVRKGQAEISQMLQKIRLLESQNNRLTQAVHTTMSQQYIYLNSPKMSPSSRKA